MIVWYVLMTSHHHLLFDKIWVKIGLIYQIMLIIIIVFLLLAHFNLILILRCLNIMLMWVRWLDGVFIFVFAWGSIIFQILLTASGGIWDIRKLTVSSSSVVICAVTSIELLILMFHSSLH